MQIQLITGDLPCVSILKKGKTNSHVILKLFSLILSKNNQTSPHLFYTTTFLRLLLIDS